MSEILKILNESDVCYVLTGNNPLLPLPDKIEDDLIFNWHDENSEIGGDVFRVEIPFENIENGKITNLGIVLEDIDGEEVVIQPYKLKRRW